MYLWLADIYSNVVLNVVLFLYRKHALILWVELANSLPIAEYLVHLFEGFTWITSEPAHRI